MIKYFVSLMTCYLILFNGNQNSFGQSSRIDNLYRQLKVVNDGSSDQLKILLSISEAQELSNPDKGIIASDMAVDLALKLNMQGDLARAYNIKARLLILKQLTEPANEALSKSIAINRKFNDLRQLAENDLTTAQFIICQHKSDTTITYINKSFHEFENSGNDLVIGKIYLFYGTYYGFLNTDSAQQLNLKAKYFFEKAGRNDWLALAFFHIATNYTSLNNNEKAFEYFKKTEDLNISLKSDFISENIYCTRGYLYFSLADFPKATSDFIKGLKIAENINDEMMQACLLGNMGAAFGSMKDYKKSKEYIDKQIVISKKINDGYTLCTGYQNLGWIEYEHQNYAGALKYFKTALELSLGIKQLDCMAESYGCVGDANEKLGNYNEAFTNIYHALELNRQQGNYYNISDNLLALSRTILNSGNSKLVDAVGGSFNADEKRQKAIEYSLEALKIAETRKTLSLKRDALKQLSDLYKLTGEEEKSYSFYKAYIAAKDSIMNSDNVKSIQLLQIKFETEKREQQIALLNTDRKIQQKEISNKKTQRNGFIAGVTLLLLIGGVTFNRYKVKQRANKELSSALKKLKEVQLQLIEQEKLASLGQLTAGIAHEIQNPLNFVINFSQLSVALFDDLENADDQVERQEIISDLEDNLNKIERHGTRAAGIIHSMLLHSANNNLVKEEIDINNLCREAINFSWQSMSISHPHFICELQLELSRNIPAVKAVAQDISRVLLNLLNNGLFAVYEKLQSKSGLSDYKAFIKMETYFNEGFIFVRVTDSGSGINEEIKNKIFQPFFTTKPTNLGTGLGLSISYDILKSHDGKLILEKSSDEGSAFLFSIPV